MDKSKRSLKSKAVFSMLLAGQLLTSSAIAQTEKSLESKSPEQVIRDVVNSSSLSPQHRAFLLFQIAVYLSYGNDLKPFQQRYGDSVKRGYFRYKLFDRDVSALAAGMVSASDIERASGAQVTPHKSKSEATVASNISHSAQFALQQGLSQVEQVTDPTLKAKLYFIASHLASKFGDQDESKKLMNIVMGDIDRCESDEKADAAQIAKSAAVLDCIAYSLVPVEFSDFKAPGDSGSGSKANFPAPTADQIAKAEVIKIHALKLVDKLPANNHVRRKAHRDMALWYQKFGNAKQVAGQKEILFNLVGWRGDEMLYAQSGGCGSPVWWEKDPPKAAFDCGMG